MIVNMVKNKGKFVVSFKKATKEYSNYLEEKREENRERVLAGAEADRDRYIHDKRDYEYNDKNENQ